jgi:hypothetical protein
MPCKTPEIFVNDKTNWRKMLKNEVDKVELVATKNQLLPEVSNMMADLDAIALNNEVVKICPMSLPNK